MCSFIPHKSHQRKTTVFNDKTPVTNKYNEPIVKTSHHIMRLFSVEPSPIWGMLLLLEIQ